MDTINKEIFNKLKARMDAKFPILLEGYLRDAKTYLARAQTNIPEGDLNDAVEAVHSLKSASGLLGITDVHDKAEALEYAGKEALDSGANRFETLIPHLAALQSAFAEVEGDLHVELSKIKS